MPEPTQLRHMELEAWKHGVESQSVKDDVILWKDVETAVKAFDLDKREVTICYSSEGIDRDGDIIVQRGIDLKAYRKNPVVLFAHGGGRFGDVRNQLPIARSVKLYREAMDDMVKSYSIDRFTEEDVHPLGDTVFRMLTHRPAFLNAASIGFRPLEMEQREAEEGEPGLFYMPMKFKKCEKLEHSIVPVPANADALVGARGAGIDLGPIKSWTEEVLDDAANAVDCGLTRSHLEECYRISNGNTKLWTVPEIEVDDVEPEVVKDPVEVEEGTTEEDKGTTPGNPSGFRRADPDERWTAPTLSAFGVTGPFEDLPAARRSRIARHFAWAERMPPTAFSQLKLPHHRASDAAVVLRGVNAALAALNGARGGVNIPSGDKRSANTHLNGHRRAFGQDPIELRDMSESEIKALLRRFAREEVELQGIEERDALETIDREVESLVALMTLIADHRRDGKEDETVKEETRAAEASTEGAGDGAESKDPVPVVCPEPTTASGEAGAESTSDSEEPKGDAATEAKEEAEGAETLEFPSIKSEADASKDAIEVQIAEVRESVRTLTGAVRQLADAIKVVGEPETEERAEPANGEAEKSGDDVVVLLGDDEPETKEETPSGEVGRFIVTETAKAVGDAIRRHTGRLPN